MSGEEKLNTCIHRSNCVETKLVRECCDILTERTGFKCKKRGLFPIGPDTCVFCGLYEPEIEQTV